MQSRSFFSLGPAINTMADSLIVDEPKIFGAIIPPTLDHLVTEAGEFFITEDGNSFITE